MSRLDDNRNKVIAKSKRRLRYFPNEDLADQLNSLQRAFAQERGESYRFRKEVLALLRGGDRW